MNNRRKGRSAFTLVEVVTTLVLAGILTVVTALTLSAMVEGLVVARANTSASEKVRLAMLRMQKEFIEIDAVPVITNGNKAIAFTSPHYPGGQTVTWAGSAGDPLLLDTDVLMDGVQLFSVSQEADGSLLIQLGVRLDGTDFTYTCSVFPRNV